MAKTTSSVCISCGDRIEPTDGEDVPEVQDAMKARCRACAREILGISTPYVGTLQHGTGGGRRVIKESKTH